MSRRYKKIKNPEFTIFVESFLVQAEENKQILNFNTTKITDLSNDNAQLKAKLLEQRNLMDSIDSVNQDVKAMREKMNKSIEYFENDADNNENVTEGMKERMGFDTNGQSSSIVGIMVPSDLLVNGTSDGINHLKWNRNGNRYGTAFIIEAKIGDSSTWTIIDVVTVTKYDHKNQTPGVKIQYRVRAKRSEMESTPSNTATVYG